MKKVTKGAWRQGKATGMCERCDNEPAEYKMSWLLLGGPKNHVYLCRFCKTKVGEQFEGYLPLTNEEMENGP